MYFIDKLSICFFRYISSRQGTEGELKPWISTEGKTATRVASGPTLNFLMTSFKKFNIFGHLERPTLADESTRNARSATALHATNIMKEL